MDKYFWSWWKWLWGQKSIDPTAVSVTTISGVTVSPHHYVTSISDIGNSTTSESSKTSTTFLLTSPFTSSSSSDSIVKSIIPANNFTVSPIVSTTTSGHQTSSTTSSAIIESSVRELFLPFTSSYPSSSSSSSVPETSSPAHQSSSAVSLVSTFTDIRSSPHADPIGSSSSTASLLPTVPSSYSSFIDYDVIYNSTIDSIFSTNINTSTSDDDDATSSTAVISGSIANVTYGLFEDIIASGGAIIGIGGVADEDKANGEILLKTVFNCSNAFDNHTSSSNVTEFDIIFGSTNVSSNCSTPTGEDFSGYGLETALHLIAILATAIILGVIILATVIGNVFVIAAILLERNLQSVANYLILSLAVADLLVACLVMPLSAVYEVSQEWKLGPELCDMWTSCDVLCCTASILHLVAIALDRYWAVTNIDYIHQRTARRIGVMILVIWGLSFLVSIAPLLGWKDPKWNERVSIDLQCIVSQDVGYQIFATASSFYVPLLVILVLYWRIFQTARKRIRRRQQVTATPPASGGLVATAAGGSGGIAAAVVTVIGRPLPTISETTTAFTNISSTHTSPEKGSFGNGVDRIEIDPPTADISMYGAATTMSGSGAFGLRPTITRKKTQTSVDSKRERKAAKTLAIITGAFVCCWLPFFILAILLPTCQCEISPLAMSLSLWLGYFNSTLNPIIYTIFSPEFRHAFKRILCGRRNSIRRRGRCVRR